VETLGRLDIPSLRILQEVPYRLELRRRRAERVVLRREYEEKVQAGIYPQHETKVPLFPYQREGMLHLAFNERALLADEMGLGKTIQAIAACTLLHRMGKAEKTLVVTPASLKAEWEEQIQRFSGLSYRLVFGPHRERLRALEHPAFFTIVNQLSERGRPEEYQNLELLRERVRPLMLRRRKADVETELPARMDRNLFVALSHQQLETYRDHEAVVARLVQLAKRRPLTQQEQERLIRELSMMRMVCDTNYILDRDDRTSPKIEELEKILQSWLAEPETKVVLFSEWERMLELVRERLRRMKIGYAWHTGSVPQKRRRAEIRVFKSDPQCRIFLSTDSGGVGLNLQNASVVINCDLPWNPAKLEQRIARAWRKNQLRAVTVINLISENTIEHRILGTLAAKQGLADGVLDAIGNLNEVKLQRKGQTFFERLELMLGPRIHLKAPPPPPLAPPADPAEAFARHAAQLLGSELVACEERFPEGQTHSVLVVVVERDPAAWRERLREGYLKSVGNGQPNSPDDMQLEVVDRFVEEAIQRLCETGILQKRIRATRHLYPESGVASRLVGTRSAAPR
jgi:SNF2 family DNA or RNA helicase